MQSFGVFSAEPQQADELFETPVAHFTKEINWSLAKPPFNGGLAKLQLISLTHLPLVLHIC